MWSLIDGKHIVFVPHHDGLLVDRVDDGLDGEIDGMAADFAIRLKEVTLDRTMRAVKQLSESVTMVNDRQTCFEYVVLSLNVDMSGVLCHLDSSNDTTGHDDGWWLWSVLSSGFIYCYFYRVSLREHITVVLPYANIRVPALY